MAARRPVGARHRVLLAVAVVTLGLSAAPPVATPAAAACGGLLTFEETPRLPRVSMFIGRAIREARNGWSVVFAIDRWFVGAHAARLIELGGTTVGIVEPPEAGTIPAITAKTTAGDAIALTRGELVFLAAGGPSAAGLYTPVLCAIESPPVASALGREYVRKATALFGPGVPASRLPPTDAAISPPPASTGVPWPAIATFALAVPAFVAMLGRRRRPWAR